MPNARREVHRAGRWGETRNPRQEERIENMLTTREVLDALRISRSSLRRHQLTGRLPRPTRIGKALRYRRDEIEAVQRGEWPRKEQLDAA